MGRIGRNKNEEKEFCERGDEGCNLRRRILGKWSDDGKLCWKDIRRKDWGEKGKNEDVWGIEN